MYTYFIRKYCFLGDLNSGEGKISKNEKDEAMGKKWGNVKKNEN